MQITCVCVGKVKEAFYRDALAEYLKRLSKYCKTSIVEVADEKTPDQCSKVVEDQIKKKEADRILAKIKPDDFVCTLEIAGTFMDSIEFSKFIAKTFADRYDNLVFVIGGSLGLHESVISRSNFHLSFSKMTFPHQLMRVVLFEQIYRAYRINSNEPYHK